MLRMCLANLSDVLWSQFKICRGEKGVQTGTDIGPDQAIEEDAHLLLHVNRGELGCFQDEQECSCCCCLTAASTGSLA